MKDGCADRLRADVALVGGGLANGLLFARLTAARPELSVVLLEAGATLGGEHTWSFHASDVTPAQLEWLRPLVSARWRGHEVVFPSYRRELPGEYLTVRSSTFHRHLAALGGERVHLSARAVHVAPTSVALEGGRFVEAGVVIDGRGFAAAPRFPCGYQSFLGLELRLKHPHGLTRPLLMDATVEQLGGFRFVYLLPFSEREVLVEDTYYSDVPLIDAALLRARVREYVARRGWQVDAVLREERAALPIPLSSEAPRFELPTVGVAAGLFHATTGYSLPIAAAVADDLAALPDAALKPAALTDWLQARARSHWASQGFFRLLNRMLFLGAEPSARVAVFESFYRHPQATIDHFYAGRLTLGDRLRALGRGAGTVDARRAISAALSAGRAG